MKKLLEVLGLAVALIMFASPVFATTWTGPTITPQPSTIPPGGAVNLVLSSTSTGTPTNSFCNSGTVGSLQYYVLNQLTIQAPDGTIYRLSISASTPLSVGGIASGDSISIPFGPGSLSIPVTSTQFGSEGPFHWNSGGQPVTDPSQETAVGGSYLVDISGTAYCGQSSSTPITEQLTFDIANNFIQTPEFGVATGLVAAVGLAGLLLVKRNKYALSN